MLEVKQEGQKAGLAEQGSPPELRPKKKHMDCGSKVRLYCSGYAVHHSSRKTIGTAKAQLELKLAGMLVDNKKRGFKYVDSKRRVKHWSVA